MRATRAGAGQVILVPVLLLSLAVPLSCKGCEERAGGSAEISGAARDAGDKLQPVDVEIDIPIGELPEGLEFGPAETKPWLRHAGTVDIEDRYASVVMIAMKNPDAPVLCSGVLVSERLVLTAGSCVCMRQPTGQSPMKADDSLQVSSCARRVSVTRVIHGREPKVQWGQRQLRTYEGSVRTHPELELRADPHGLSAIHADLAAIVLDEPVREQLAEALLAGSEVREGEALIMAGYGQDEAMGGERGVRYYRKNKTKRIPYSADDRILYEQQGAYVYNGFAGGPCFREEQGGRWLVGIAGRGSEEELSCTSLHVHREWVRDEVQRARQGSSAHP
jgi:hypothetical protein